MKIGLFIGASTFLAYSYSNKFLPKGLTLGDSLLFLFIALCFGLLYVLSIFGLTGLGVVLSPLLRITLHAINFILRKTKKKELQPTISLYKFHWSSLLFGIYGLIMVILFWIKSWYLGVFVLALSLALYIFLSLIVYRQSEIDRLNNERSSAIEIKGRDRTQLTQAIKENRTTVFLGVAFLVLTPLSLSYISSTFVEGTMRLAGVRIDNALLYLKPPYSRLINDEFIVKECPPIAEEYSCFRLTILFTGAGNTTLVKEPKPISGKTISIEVPNEEIIIVRGR